MIKVSFELRIFWFVAHPSTYFLFFAFLKFNYYFSMTLLKNNDFTVSLSFCLWNYCLWNPTLIFYHGAQNKPIICAKILSYDLWQFVPTLALSRCVNFNSIILSSRHGGRGILEDEVSKIVGYPHWWNLIYTTFRALYCMEDAVLET